MKFRKQNSARESDLEYEDFKARVAAGEIGPLDEVRDSYFTDDEWRTVNNLRVFHKLSPGEYERGEILAEDLAGRDAEQKKRARFRDIFSTISRSSMKLYQQRENSVATRLASLLDKDDGISGISLLVMESAGPPLGLRRSYFLLYRLDGVEIHSISTPFGIANFEFDEIDTPRSVEARVRQLYAENKVEFTFVDTSRMPEIIQSWPALVRQARLAAQDTLSFGAIRDGEIYSHRLLTEAPDYSATWHAPTQIGPIEAGRLVSAYLRASRTPPA